MSREYDGKLRRRFLLGSLLAVVLTVLVSLWLSNIVRVRDPLLDTLVFMSLFTLVFSAVGKVFDWEKAYESDERTEFIRMATVDRAARVWMYAVFVLVLVVVVAWGYGLVETGGEVIGFVKGLGLSALIYAVAYLAAWVRVYRAYS